MLQGRGDYIGEYMRDYATVSPQFWLGKTGRELRNAGAEAQVVAFYLMTSPHANMLGLYYLPVLYLAHETGLGLEGASKGLERAIEAGFCSYDEHSEMIWVHEMAAYQVGRSLKPGDNRCAGVRNEYASLPENPFLPAFFDRYQNDFHLVTKRQSERGFKGASKGPPSQDQDQEQDQEQNKQCLSDSKNIPNRTDYDPPDAIQQAFEKIFWPAGLRKVAKVKALPAFEKKYRAWKKSNGGLPDAFARMLAEDIRLRLSARVFGFDKLLPASYLNGERWNDERPGGGLMVSQSMDYDIPEGFRGR